MTDALPFDGYPQNGRGLLGPPRWGDGTARRSYGLEVLGWCGYRCGYCGLDLGTFEGWLQLSIDHVVPQQMVKSGYPKSWVMDQMNIVACCMACNGLFNRDLAPALIPTTLEEFIGIRDAVFLTRRARILERRDVERGWFDATIAPRVVAAAPEPGQGELERARRPTPATERLGTLLNSWRSKGSPVQAGIP